MVTRFVTVALMALSWSLATSAAALAGELKVFAGAGLRQPVEAVAKLFEQESGAKVTIEYGGSGQLLARIKETGTGDVFIPGSMVFFDGLEKDGQIVSKRALAIHGAVLAVNKGAAAKVTSFADLAKPGVRVALGDAQAMALGRTAEAILTKSGQKDAILANVVVRAATVQQLALYVVNGDVDAAIVGGPEVAKNAATVVGVEIPAALYEPEIAGVAVLKTATEPAAAEKFADLLASERGQAAFAAAGFPPAKR